MNRTIQATRLGVRTLVQRRPVSVAPALRLGSSASIWAPSTRAFTQHNAPRYFSSAVATTEPLSSRSKFALGVAGGLFLAGLHSATGSSNDFYDYRFKTEKSPDDLASFYGGEEFMELFCVFPFVGQIMMRNGDFDEEGNVITTGIPGTLKVSMVFSDDVNKDSGETEWFNKRERFRNTLWGYTCWDMVSNFGFRTLEDGTVEAYHYGEYFHGNLPVVSQIMKLVFQVHARWLAWSTEHHINHYAFTADSDEEEELEEESRKNMPLFLLKHYAWSDLMAMVFGIKEDVEHKKNPSFLVRRRSSTDANTEDDKLPIQSKAKQIQISQDIAYDRESVKQLLARSSTQTPEDVKAALARSYTLKNAEANTQGNAYGFATEAARIRHMTRRGSARPAEVNLSTEQQPATSKMSAAPRKNPAGQGSNPLKRQPSSMGA